MKLLIVYGTKSGASKECAYFLSTELSGATLLDIEQQQPNIAEFSHVIIGAGVRNDKMYKPIRDFLKNQIELLSKTVACYLCNSKPKTTEQVIVDSISKAVREASIEITSFGGYKPSWVPISEENKLKGIDLEKISEFAKNFIEYI